MGKNIDWSQIVAWVLLIAFAIYIVDLIERPKKEEHGCKDRTYDAIVYYQIQIDELDNIMRHYIKHPALDSSGHYYGLDSISYYYGEQQAYQDAIRFLVDTSK